LSEHGDVIDNANNNVYPPQSSLANSVPGKVTCETQLVAMMASISWNPDRQS